MGFTAAVISGGAIMDKHEKGIEVEPHRPDVPLPKWDGKYGGDQKRLPKVIQKLLLRRPLTAEEKAELLWRYYELEQGGRVRERLMWILTVLLCLACFAERILHNGVVYPISVFAHGLQSCRNIIQHAVPLRLHQNARAPYHPQSVYGPGYFPCLGLINEHYVRAR